MGGQPYRHGADRYGELDHHAGRTDHCPAPLVGYHCGGRSIHVRCRHEGEDHDAELVHLVAGQLDGVGVAELVQDLQHREDQQQGYEIIRRQEPIADVARKAIPMKRGLDHEPRDACNPQQCAQKTAERPHEVDGGVKEAVRIGERKPQEHRVLKTLRCHAAGMRLRARGELAMLYGPVRIDKIGSVELRHYGDDLVLRGRVFAKLLYGLAPDRVERAGAVHPHQDCVDGGRETIGMYAESILGDVPHLAANHMAFDQRLRPQARAEPLHPVPLR